MLSPATTLPRFRVLFAVLLVTACGDSDSTGPDGGEVAALNGFETEVVGLWHRHHSFDGSDRFWLFNADRTACQFKEASGSNRKYDLETYASWSISESQTGSVLSISGVPGDMVYNFSEDTVYPRRFPGLANRPSGSSKTCS